MHSLITAFSFTFRATSNKQNYLNQPTHYEPIITPQIMLNNIISTNITMLLIQLIMMSNYMNIFFSLAVTFLLTPKLASVVSSTNFQHNFTRKVWAFEKDYKQYLYIHTRTHIRTHTQAAVCFRSSWECMCVHVLIVACRARRILHIEHAKEMVFPDILHAPHIWSDRLCG